MILSLEYIMSKSRTIASQRIIAPVLILLLPLLPALMVVGWNLVIPVVLPSTELQKVVRVLTVGLPLAILIWFGRSTGDGFGSAIAGALLFPLITIYSEVIGQMSGFGLLVSPPDRLIWGAFSSAVLFILILSVMGYFASKKTNGSLLVALALAGLVMAIMMGIN